MTAATYARPAAPAPAVPPAPGPARWLALGAVAGPVLFTLTWFVLGFLSPGMTFSDAPELLVPASPVTTPISGLGLGPTGPLMNAAFVLSGLLVAVGVVGVFRTRAIAASGRPAARRASATLLALSGVGMAVAGAFTLESFLFHFAGFLIGTGTPVVSFLVAGSFLRGVPGWRRFGAWLRLASPLTLGLLVLSQATYDQAAVVAGQGIAGLTSRLLALEVVAWFAGMGWLAFRRG